jgi:lactate dehydrogenase-like 2-hydroxyacid dehydrogenase
MCKVKKMAIMKLLYIGVNKENLEKYYPSYIKGEFLKDTYTEDELVNVVIGKNISVLMVDVFRTTFTMSLLQKLKGHIKLINCLYQSIESLIDLKEAESCGIEVKKLPDNIYCNEVAEFAITQLLCACKGTIQFNKSIKNGEWNQAVNTNLSVRGRTLGIVGFGNIGKHIIKLCANWGLNIVVTRKHLNKNQVAPNVTFVGFSDLIENSDYIIFAVPLNKDTFQMFNENHIGKLKKNAIIVNISRGNIVDENAIHEALRLGKLYKYCTDVFSQEPINRDHVFLNSDKTILSPHVAWATEDTLKKAYDVWFGQTNI